MEINNDNRDDERRAAEKRESARLDKERRQKIEPMRTFEAKLSEKAAHEISAKESQQNTQKYLSREKKEKESILEKVLKSHGEEVSDSIHKSHHEDIRHQDFEHEKHDTALHDERRSAEELLTSKESKESLPQNTRTTREKSSTSDVAEEGYRRVGSSSGQEGENASSGGSMGGGGSSQQDSSSGESSQQEFSRKNRDLKKLSDVLAERGLKPLAKDSGAYSGFHQNAREFSEKDLEELVTRVEAGVNECGEDYFQVTLADPYFAGLELRATRTPEGVVLSFLCPNVTVRSTFIKQRPEIYSRLKARKISVVRIDIV